jgi:release factor glutamine methyltransferase
MQHAHGVNGAAFMARVHDNSCYSPGMSETWTVRRMIAWMVADFEKRGNESARLDADLLVALALGLKRIALYLDLDRPLMAGELAQVRALVERRRKREPMAYILGEREFYGRPFKVSPAVLIPRPDTETLVEQALPFCKQTLLDLCTGSGAVALSLLAEKPELHAVATDLSAEALAQATENAQKLGVIERVTFRQGDLFAVLTADERFDCITVNPPYISTSEIATLAPDVRDYEPRQALDAGDDALSFYRRISVDGPRHLNPGGALLVEVGIHQAGSVAQLFRAAGLQNVRTQRDLAGIERVVMGVA